jgi:hypothetical protein
MTNEINNMISPIPYGFIFVTCFVYSSQSNSKLSAKTQHAVFPLGRARFIQAANIRTVRYCRWSKVVNGVKESLSARHALHL